MMSEKKVPAIRFRGFEDDWEQRKLSDIYKDIGNAFVGTATPYYVEEGHFYLESNNIKDGLINHNTEVFINDVFYENQKDKWLHTGDMVMVQSGHVGHAAVIPKELDCSAAHALIMFRNPKVEIEPYFLNYQYQTAKSKKKIENITTGNTIKHILASEMQEFIVDVTSYGEQKKIAGFFRDLDNLITLHQCKLEKLKIVKKSMLVNCFPKNGEKVPKFRFSGFTGDWEQRKLGELAEIKDSARIPNAEWSDFGVPYIRASDITNKDASGVLFISNERYEFYKNKTGAPIKGDVLFNGGGEIGKTMLNSSDSPIYVQGGAVLYARTSISDNLEGQYLKTYFETPNAQHYFETASAGGTMKHFTLKPSQEMPIKLPQMKEQKKIGSFFSELDTLITLHQRELKKLQMIKKSMLRSMFV